MSPERLAGLQSAEPRTRVAVLRALLVAPDPAPAVVAALETLLDDSTVTIVSFPIRIGEIRGLAAEVLAATRSLSAATRGQPVVLDPEWGTFTPVELGAIAATAGVDVTALDPPGRYALLRDQGRLPRRRREYHPAAFQPA